MLAAVSLIVPCRADSIQLSGFLQLDVRACPAWSLWRCDGVGYDQIEVCAQADVQNTPVSDIEGCSD
jgi:hypothetical protein